MSHNGNVTIKEAARLLDISEKTLSRYVQKGRILSETVQDRGRKRKYFKIETLERFRKEYCPGQSETNSSHVQDSPEETETVGDSPGQSRTNIKTLIKEAITEQQSQLMRPLEQQALFVAGKLTQENQELKERLETLRQENELYREQIRALPGPSEMEKVKAEYEEKLSLAREQAEREKIEIVEAWKKELEMSKRPWYKFW